MQQKKTVQAGDRVYLTCPHCQGDLAGKAGGAHFSLPHRPGLYMQVWQPECSGCGASWQEMYEYCDEDEYFVSSVLDVVDGDFMREAKLGIPLTEVGDVQVFLGISKKETKPSFFTSLRQLIWIGIQRAVVFVLYLSLIVLTYAIGTIGCIFSLIQIIKEERS